MAFLKPQYSNEPFELCDMGHGERCFVPSGYVPDGCHHEPAEKGWYYRLSASGYMDCTEWTGPSPTLEDAKRALMNEYVVHPDTGDEFEDDADTESGPICGVVGCSCWTKDDCAESAKETQ